MHLLTLLCTWQVGYLLARAPGHPSLWVEAVGDEDVAAPVEDWNAYSEQLLVYLIGLAMVGATPVSPSPATPESLATDTTDYVQFPWDLAWRYHARAVQCAKRYPETNRLAVVSSLDLHVNGRRSSPTPMKR